MAARTLITGMSGTGKSSVIAALRHSELEAHDLDADEFSHWVPCEGNPTGARDGFDWLWNELKLGQLLRREREGPLFVAGCASNMGGFLKAFDRIVLLTASPEALSMRIQTRTSGNYGKLETEWRQILENMQTFEPRLRRIASHIVDTDLPLAAVVGRVREIGCAPVLS